MDFRVGIGDIPPPQVLTYGLCTQMGYPDLWFQDRSPIDTREAILICRKCPVRAECLEYALQVPWLRGVWGGTTYGQRQDRMTC